MNDLKKQWERLAANLPQNGDAALITNAPDMMLLTGFFFEGAVIVTANEAALLTDSRYIEAAENHVADMPCVLFANQSMTDAVDEWLAAHGVKRVFVQTDHMSLTAFDGYRKNLTKYEWSDDGLLNDCMRKLRSVKSPEQIDKLRAAQKITDDGFSYILSRIEAGRTEREVALDLEFYMRRQGSQGVSFDFIVVAGENGSLPHGVPGDRVIQKGDFVTMDFGALVDGWHADMTRTVAVGEPADWQKEIYDVVLRAQENCLAHVKAGMTGAEGDALTRDIIKAAGYGEYFGHSTGHGVGLEIHELPNLSSRATAHRLLPGEVVTVEPGIYLPGKGGVRIEDMAVITEQGCDNLTKSPKNLIIL